MRMLSKKDFSAGKLETLKGYRSRITVVTVNGEVQTTEEAQVYAMIFIFSSLCNWPRTLLTCCPLANSAKRHGYT